MGAWSVCCAPAQALPCLEQQRWVLLQEGLCAAEPYEIARQPHSWWQAAEAQREWQRWTLHGPYVTQGGQGGPVGIEVACVAAVELFGWWTVVGGQLST